MSGSGGGGDNTNDWRPASTISNPVATEETGAVGGAAQVGPNPCLFTEVTNLASPNITVVTTLTVGSVLAVVLQTAPAKSSLPWPAQSLPDQLHPHVSLILSNVCVPGSDTRRELRRSTAAR